MEILIIAVLAIGVLVLGTLLVLALKRGHGQGLTQFEQRLADELRKQEKLLEERLAGFGDRVTGRLSEQQKESQTTLAQLGERLAVIDQAQKNITELSTQVVSLQELLSNKQARGAFGEEQLEALVRDLLPANYIEFQASLSNGKRVDCLLKLPAPLGPLAIDAKFPREAYDALRAAQGDPQQRLRAGQLFGQSVLKHVKDIADRYIVPGETAEAALMFLPSEAVYAEIHDQLPDIADKARRMRVFIVSPTTLWAVLNTMRAILKDQRLQAQARAMQVEVQKLLVDVQRLDDRAANLEKHFGQVTGDVREIRISSGKVLSRGEKIEAVELEVQQEMLEEKT